MIVSTRVTYRSEMGRFMSACDIAAQHSAKELATVMWRRAKRRAPSGPPRRDYGRRPKLRPSIKPVLINSKEWAVVALARHAGAIEHGGRAHVIPNAWGHEGVVVEHPGNDAHPFLLPAVAEAQRQWKRILAKNYPG